MRITEENFIAQLKMRNEKSIDYILDNYGWIIKSIVKKNLYNLGNFQDECINDVLLAIWYNIESFDEGRGQFTAKFITLTPYAIQFPIEINKSDNNIEQINDNDLVEIGEEFFIQIN